MGDSDNYYRLQCCCICSYTIIKSWQLCVVSKSVIHMRLTVTMQHVNCAGIVRVMMRCLVRRTPPSFLIKALQPNTFHLLLHTHLLSLAIFHLTLPSLYILFFISPHLSLRSVLFQARGSRTHSISCSTHLLFLTVFHPIIPSLSIYIVLYFPLSLFVSFRSVPSKRRSRVFLFLLPRHQWITADCLSITLQHTV